MKKWTTLVVDVDYRPADPHASWDCDRSEYPKAELKAGQNLSYIDSGGLFTCIKVVSVSDDSLVLEYRDTQYELKDGSSSRQLDEGGRDYCNFYLHVWLRLDVVLEDSPAFYRQFFNKDRVAAMSEDDIKLYRCSDSPLAKYVVGRWMYLMAPDGRESFSEAEALLKEAADAGVADAYEVLAQMASFEDADGNAPDMEAFHKLRDEALSRGSELAQLHSSRNRIAGVLDAVKEPEKVAAEIEARFAADADISPEWYSVLGFAYDTLGDARAVETYKKGVEAGCLACYCDLSIYCWSSEDKDGYRLWMEKGMEAGCAWCYCLDADMGEDEFMALSPVEQRIVHENVERRLLKGLSLGDGACAYWLAGNIYYGCMGFERNTDKALEYAQRGIELRDEYSKQFYDKILEESAEAERDEDDGRWDAYV